MSYEKFKERSHRLQDVLAIAIWGFFSYTLITYPETRTREFWLYGDTKPFIDAVNSRNTKEHFPSVSLEQGLSFLPENARSRLVTTAR